MICEVLVIEYPKKVKDEEPELERIVLGPKVVVAKSEQSAAVLVLRDPDFPTDAVLERCEVVVRPFVNGNS